jgi:hypothetical protein
VYPAVFFSLVEIIIQLVHLFVYGAGNLIGHTQEGCTVNLIELEEHPQRKDLQHDECQESNVSANEKKDVSHGGEDAATIQPGIQAYSAFPGLRFFIS